jgi:undecaprenyl diphosphate synthase
LPEGLKHIAIIMDGNGRWAKKHSRNRLFGHRQGSKAVKVIVETCAKAGLEYLSLFAFSTENWDRPADEVKSLMELFSTFLRQQSGNIIKNKIRFKITGEFDRLPKKVQELANDLIETTANNKGMTLNLAVSYGGRQEILQAVKRIAEDVRTGSLKPSDIDQKLFNSYLWTCGMPDPDLLIRTSGEFRISNFMIWQTAYTEIYITKVLWPDFDKTELNKAIEDFTGRKRRFGKVLD